MVEIGEGKRDGLVVRRKGEREQTREGLWKFGCRRFAQIWRGVSGGKKWRGDLH